MKVICYWYSTNVKGVRHGKGFGILTNVFKTTCVAWVWQFGRKQNKITWRHYTPDHKLTRRGSGELIYIECNQMSSSKRQSFVIGRAFAVPWNFTFAALTRPSAPGITSVTIPSGHCPRGTLSSETRTRSFSLRFSFGVNHLLLCCSVGKYSESHLRQNVSAR